MKTILIPTDFSAGAGHAAEYGYFLAKQIKADIILCNVVTIPAEAPLAGLVAWPMDESDELLESSTDELKKLKAHCRQHDQPETYRPGISFLTKTGTVKEMVNSCTYQQQVDLVIAGAHQQDGLSTFLLGNHTRELIDTCVKPLLIVPRCAGFKPIKKIAFATDFKEPEEDLEFLFNLITLARPLNADILLTNVYNEKYSRLEFQLWINEFMSQLSNKADYPHIYYRPVTSAHAEDGLDWLCENGQIDMLAMVHRQHGFFDNLINGSTTQKMASHITIPLLVYPGK